MLNNIRLQIYNLLSRMFPHQKLPKQIIIILPPLINWIQSLIKYSLIIYPINKFLTILIRNSYTRKRIPKCGRRLHAAFIEIPRIKLGTTEPTNDSRIICFYCLLKLLTQTNIILNMPSSIFLP